ncbi:hypothetical protein SCACP_35330 [Sporomusa carbonis]|uniref:HIRAN domain-containing protein n=1 Tax=Sporomusa carbonis TaxID=3076075 RepID=UPI003A75CB1F
MEARYIAIVGCKNYYGTKILKPGIPVRLEKEPDNEYDAEAIAVFIMPVGKVGYVANSTHTVPKGCCSAGRIYDTFGEHAYGIIRFVVQDTAIVEMIDNSAIHFEIKMEVFEDAGSEERSKPGF